MKSIEELIKELNELPQGYLVKKRINNKEYFYLQKRIGGKITSKYIPKEEVIAYKQGLERRKEIEKSVDKLVNNSNKNLCNLDKNSKELTGNIMMGDEVVASFDKERLTYINNEKAPLFIKRTGSIRGFLRERAIDLSRTNSRLLKKVLNIKEVDNEYLVLRVHALTLTDNYWFKPRGSRLKYEDICFDSDIYGDLALKGEILVYPKKSKLSPELTLGGSYEKCWKRIDGKWYMYKVGTKNEIFSEIFSSRLASFIGIKTAFYEKAGIYIRTKNFATNYNYEPMSSLAGEDSSYLNVLNVLTKINKKLVAEYIKLIYFDVLVNNVDRHNENLGFLRDKHSGKIVSLAPNFDNNLSLISRNAVLNMDPRKDKFLEFFIKFIKSNKTAKDDFLMMDMIDINEQTIDLCFIDLENDANKEDIKKYILGRFEYIKAIRKKL